MPTSRPQPLPTPLPSSIPSELPSSLPTLIPTTQPTPVPTLIPTGSPTSLPSPSPSPVPTLVPSPSPTLYPSQVPTVVPSTADAITISTTLSLAATSLNVKKEDATSVKVTVADSVKVELSSIRNFEIYAYEDNVRRSLLAIIWDVSMEISVSLALTTEVSADSFSNSLLNSLSSDNFTSALMSATSTILSVQSVKAWPLTRSPTSTPSSYPTPGSTFSPSISLSESVSAAGTSTSVILISLLAAGSVVAAFSCYYELHLKPARRGKIKSKNTVAPIPATAPPVTLEEGSSRALVPFTLKDSKSFRPWLECRDHEESATKHNSFWSRIEAEEKTRTKALVLISDNPLRPMIENKPFEGAATTEHSSFFEPSSNDACLLPEGTLLPKRVHRSRKVQPILPKEDDEDSVLPENSTRISLTNRLTASNDQRHIKLKPLKLKEGAPTVGVVNEASTESDPRGEEYPNLLASASPKQPEKTIDTLETPVSAPTLLARTMDDNYDSKDETHGNAPSEEAQLLLLIKEWDRELARISAELQSLEGRHYKHQRKLRIGTLPSPNAAQFHNDSCSRVDLETWRRKEHRKIAKIASRMSALHSRHASANENRRVAVHALEAYISDHKTDAACPTEPATPRVKTMEGIYPSSEAGSLRDPTIGFNHEGTVADEEEAGNEVVPKQTSKVTPKKLAPLPNNYTPDLRGL